MNSGGSGRSEIWFSISFHEPTGLSQSQITIGIGISRNRERAEATVAVRDHGPTGFEDVLQRSAIVVVGADR